jgi:N-acetyltransferase 10
MGYGSRALFLLKQYYEFKIPSIEEDQLPQEHIECVADENVGLLEERIGNFFTLTCCLYHTGCP